MKPSDEKWILCPICGAKTRARLLPDTVLRNFPLFCPKCRQESIINAQNYHVIKINPQPDAVLTTRSLGLVLCLFLLNIFILFWNSYLIWRIFRIAP